MKKNDGIISKQKQRGFTMLELLLVVGVGAILLLGVVQVTDAWVKYLKSEQSGEHMEVVRRSVDDFLHSTDPAVLFGLTPPLAGNVGDITNNSDFWGYLPSGQLSLTNPLGRDVNVRLRRIVIPAAPPVPQQTSFEVYIYTVGEPIINKMLLSAANAIGAYGGIIARIRNPAAASAEAQSLFGTWVLNAGQLGVIGLDLTTASTSVTEDGGQLAVYYSVSPQEVPGPYLYRSNIDGTGQYNTMETALYMNNFNIVNAGNITAANVASTGTVTIGGALTADSAAISGNLESDTITVTGGATINGNLVMNGAANTVNGSLTATGIAAETVETNTIQTDNLGSATMQTENTLNVGALTATNVDSFEVNGTVEADSITVGDTLAVSDKISTSNVQVVGGTVNVQGDITLQGDMVTENMAVNKCLTVGTPGTSYGNCP